MRQNQGRARKKKRSAVKVFLVLLIILAIGFFGAVSVVNHYFPLRYVDIINNYAEIHELNPTLVFAVIHAESRFNPDVVSRAGASGLMQIMESTAYWLAPQAAVENFDYAAQIFDPEINIRLGTFYLNMLLNRFGDLDVALAAYNAGSGNVGSCLRNPDYSSDGVTLDHIPFPETRNYVNRVAQNMQIYEIILRFQRIFIR